MSQSTAPNGDEQRGGTPHESPARAAPGGSHREASPDELLAAEIADHLASATDELQRRGAASAEAARLALGQFGDVARVKRQCWWIHHGEDFMFRTLGIALLGALTLAVTVVGYGTWRLQRDLASRTDQFSEEIASLTATQQALLTQQRPPVVRGAAYLGDRSRPAADVEIQVFRFSGEPITSMGSAESGIIARRLRTDAKGRFDSGVLQPGEYCILAPLQSPAGKTGDDELLFSRLQSRPLYLTTGVGNSTVDLDLQASARVRLEATGIPETVTIQGEEMGVFVQLSAWTDGDPYFERRPIPPSAEPPSGGWPVPLPNQGWATGAASRRPNSLPHDWWLAPRAYSFELSVFIQKRSDESAGNQYGFVNPLNSPIYTKSVSVTAKLTSKNSAIISVRLPDESLQDRIAAAEVGPAKGVQLQDREALATILRGIEPDVTVTLPEPDAAAP